MGRYLVQAQCLLSHPFQIIWINWIIIIIIIIIIKIIISMINKKRATLHQNDYVIIRQNVCLTIGTCNVLSVEVCYTASM